MPSQLEHTIRIRQSIGPYRIQGLLGSGGMGLVYLAKDPTLRRTVAIKVVDTSKHDQSALHLLVREARLAAALSHPSICSVHEIGHIGDEPFIAASEAGVVQVTIPGTTKQGLLTRNVEIAIYRVTGQVGGNRIGGARFAELRAKDQVTRVAQVSADALREAAK